MKNPEKSALTLGHVASVVGKGLFAGLAGTAAMTLSQIIEMKLSGREPSNSPAQVGSKLFGVEPKSKEDEGRFAQIIHWVWGTVGGVPRGLIALSDTHGAAAAASHFATLWTMDSALLYSLGIAPPPWEWSAMELSVDAFHKSVYAIVANATYEFLDR